MASQFKVSKTVLNHAFGYFVIPAGMMVGWYAFGQTEEEKLKAIEEKYGDKVRASRAQRENMQAFFDKVKAGDEGTNDKLNEVMLAGKKKVVRHYAMTDPEGEVATPVKKTPGQTKAAVDTRISSE
mmetsp:Transcript_7030/g.16074  ORF Transcript_7030/g.16074 Transcript_7030/m.16074 type:complete len:126 (+) Transcript_7030:223-600(+)|eukprot:CAMPEP_0172597334 /NCGR_PEP_ID=MMETSP1068-20121228/17320_1 /TAXON_ID=35684 /ORGANISM="Pseudopedinella elastica, Strain CCMP716" /LENGTH=125 /DNA_ID=CAMNT_0013396811 /DNA_START=153 /DNA_END=530 /DNA_ORIENTATION=-